MTVKASDRVVIVSDSTGETAAGLMKAAMVQFPDRQVSYIRYRNVRTESQIDAICDAAATNKDLIVFTIVSPELRKLLLQKATALDIASVDLLGPLLIGLANRFGYEPKLIAGLLRDVNEEYFKRVDAMEYTIAHDDGRNLKRLEIADLIILGISRTSKTPLSMYLSHQGWKICNVPLIRGFEVPKEVHEVDQKKVIALTINPEHLARIRKARLKRFGSDKGGDYASLDRVQMEVEFANEIYRKNRRWAVFDVTGKAIEETASEIIKLMSSRRLIPPHASRN